MSVREGRADPLVEHPDFLRLNHTGHGAPQTYALRTRVVRSGIAGNPTNQSIFSSGEANEFASDFYRMHYRGFWIIHDDIRCARPETILERATGWYLDAAIMGAEKRRWHQDRALWD